MFDHVKFGVSDYAASKAFFLKALEPLDHFAQHLTSSSSAAPSESGHGYLWKYFNRGNGRKQAG